MRVNETLARRVLSVMVAALLLSGTASAITLRARDDSGGDSAVDVHRGRDASPATSVDADPELPLTPRQPETSEPSAAAPSTTSTTSGRSPATTARATGAPATTTVTQPVSSAVDPGAAAPPAAGTYRYSVITDGDEESEELAKLRVKPAAATAKATEKRQDVIDDYDGSTHTMLWRGDGVYLERTLLDSDDAASECNWEPDALVWKLPLAAGSEWSADTRCSSKFPEGDMRIHVVSKSKVTGAKRVDVDGQAVDVWVVAEMTTVTFDGTYDGEPLTGTQEITRTVQFSPRYGLEIRSSETVKDTADGETHSYSEERELLSLRAR